MFYKGNGLPTQGGLLSVPIRERERGIQPPTLYGKLCRVSPPHLSTSLNVSPKLFSSENPSIGALLCKSSPLSSVNPLMSAGAGWAVNSDAKFIVTSTSGNTGGKFGKHGCASRR